MAVFDFQKGQNMKFYKIEAGILLDKCTFKDNVIYGTGEILYFKTKEEYETGNEHFVEPFRFSFDVIEEILIISDTEYVSDVDPNELISNIKNNVFPMFDIEI